MLNEYKNTHKKTIYLLVSNMFTCEHCDSCNYGAVGNNTDSMLLHLLKAMVTPVITSLSMCLFITMITPSV